MENRTVIIKRDGNMWCAHRDDFINLQESLAGFGGSEREALGKLRDAEGILWRQENVYKQI